ncbi:MAG: SMC family ATPase [Bacteroidales bacterium]|nr:SMC family ATPase [Bacteroidales bacterium]
MKILELHIRNIASIEHADIDFEHDTGLIDPDTQQPAQKFLIFGDTGTGKSVLLDGITMALYKDTPRLRNTTQRNNEYVNASGESIKIFNIEQYTRIGISEREECYSEVVFIGNDNRLYRARLTLGMKMSKGTLKYATPKWQVKITNQDWTDRETGTIILDAVGITFEQFNRMAMLAQGQFATFLCGNRDERADILEKLTNTEIFSRYGKAIAEITKDKKKKKESAQDLLAQTQKFITPPEEVERMEAMKRQAEEALSTAKKQRAALENRISLLEQLATFQKTLQEAEQQRQELLATMESDTHKTDLQLVTDWDNTEKERTSLTALESNRRQLADCKYQAEQLRQRFTDLAADLILRREEIDTLTEQTDKETQWVAERQQHDGLFTHADAAIGQMKHYSEDIQRLEGIQKRKEDNVKAIPELEQSLGKATEEKASATAAVEQKQQAIDNLKQQRDQYDVNQIDADEKRLTLLKTAYENLGTDHARLEENRKTLENSQQELTNKKDELSKAQQRQAEAQQQSDTKKRVYQQALQRFTTLNASLDDTLVELRAQMAEAHSERCPLCGQQLSVNVLTQEQFQHILSPLKAEQEHAKTKADEAQQVLNKAMHATSQLEGQIRNIADGCDKLAKQITHEEKTLHKRMVQAEIDPQSDVAAIIKQRVEQIGNQLEELQKQRKAVNNLQQQIDTLDQEKKPLDKNKSEAEQKWQQAQNDVTNNSNKINDLTKEINDLATTLATERTQLDNLLKTWRPDWHNDLTVTIQILKQEASEYLSHKEALEKGQRALANSRTLVNNLTNIELKIRETNSDWQTDEQARELTCDDIQHEWNNLSTESSALKAIAQQCEKNMEECDKVLQSWILRTGKSLDILQQLLTHKDDITVVRTRLTDLKNDLKNCESTLQNAQHSIIQKRQELQLGEEDPVPDLADIVSQRDEQSALIESALSSISEADTILKNSQKNQNEIQRLQEDLARCIRVSDHWETVNKTFGGDRFRNLVQTHILRPLLDNANIYLRQISNRYTLTCSEKNEQLAILVLDGYNRNEVRSAALLSGGEKFMISLALSLALSSLNRPDMNVNILFIDEGFGTLDQECLDSVMKTLGQLPSIIGGGERRVGIISHREELLGCIPNKIKLIKNGEGRSRVTVTYEP